MNINKKSISLIALVITVAALMTVYLVIKNTDTTPIDTGGHEIVLIVDFDHKNTAGISFDNANGSFQFTKDADGWVYSDDPMFPLKEELVTSMSEVMASIVCEKHIEAGDNGEFGFEKPEFKITVNYADGNEYTYILGCVNSFTSQRYLKTQWDGAVYLVDDSITALFDCKLSDLVRLDSIPSEIKTSEITGFVVRGNNGEENSVTDKNGVAALYEQFAKINFKIYADYYVSADEKADYGIDDSNNSVTVRYKLSSTSEKEYTIVFGKRATVGEGDEAKDIVYYALPEGSIVYELDYITYSTMMSYLTYIPDGN